MKTALLEMVKILCKRRILPGFAAIIFLFFVSSCMSPYGIYHRVEAGETIADLEDIYGVSAREILEINELPKGTEIRPGQRIFIPGADRAVHKKPTVSYKPAPSTPPSNIPETREESKTKDVGKFMDDLIWPIPEKDQAGRYFKNDSLIIKAAQGTEVVAASGGTVIYLERSVAGYGNMIIVDRDGQMQAIYGGLGDVKVKEGEKVSRGERIGKVGPPLTSEGPALVFEVRVNGKLERPIFFLP